MVVFRTPGLEITHVSENVLAILGTSSAKLLGAPIKSLFVDDEALARQEMLLQDVSDSKPVYLFTVRLRGKAEPFDAIAHRTGDLVFLEFEPTPEDRELSTPELYRFVQRSIVRLQLAPSVEHMYRVCADQVRRISGFDRVMVYRFDAEWNGEVVAEAKREDLEPFLGLHYPASDIPKQARDLYTKNWLRFIPNRDYTPSPVLSGPDSDGPLDMSFAVLRSVSPIHLEYLRNMGVGASMSISLIHEGQLWGLIACHHSSPRFVPYDVRTACELLGQVMSLHLGVGEQREIAGDNAVMKRVRQLMLLNLEQFEDTATALIDSDPNMLAFIDADGAAVVVEDQITRIGQTPGEEEIRQLSAWIVQNSEEEVFATDNLRSVFGSALFGSVASGLLAISVTTTRAHQLLWFRTEQIRTVNWAGDPAKSLIKGDGEARLSPRGSFALWKETVKGRSRPWRSSELEAAQLLHDGIMRQLLRRAEKIAAVHTDLRLASQEREKLLDSERAARSELERVSRMKDDFVATLSHELRTPLNAIYGWAQILVRQEGLDPEVAEGLQIIERNARSQAQMIDDLLEMSRIISGKIRLDLQRTHVPTVVDAAVETIALAATAKEIRIEKIIDPMIGVETTADPNRLQQVFWNLLSNAVKFTPKNGKIQVVLERVDSHIELSVADNGNGISPEFLPHVFDRFRQADTAADRKHSGLGLGLSIVRNLVELHGGNVRAQSPGLGRGTTFVVSLPVRVLHQSDPEPVVHPNAHSMPSNREETNLTGTTILVVDDERDGRELVKRLLEGSGARVTTAGSKNDAIAECAQNKFDVIISDIGMQGGNGYDLIKEMRELESRLGRAKTPAIALTAYARTEDRRRVILAGYQAHVAKPVESGELLALVASLAGRA
jgi:chemotaxis family two-component system sensor kinase Cph1